MFCNLFVSTEESNDQATAESYWLPGHVQNLPDDDAAAYVAPEDYFPSTHGLVQTHPATFSGFGSMAPVVSIIVFHYFCCYFIGVLHHTDSFSPVHKQKNNFVNYNRAYTVVSEMSEKPEIIYIFLTVIAPSTISVFVYLHVICTYCLVDTTPISISDGIFENVRKKQFFIFE